MIAGEPFLLPGSTWIWILALVVGVLAALGLPLFAAIASAALLAYAASDPALDWTLVFTQMSVIVDQSIYVTIPLFVLAGVLLAESRAPTRLLEFCRALFGWIPGGIAIVATVSCAFFTSFTGASGVTIVALGGLLYPMLVREGYPSRFSLGLATAGGSLGLLFPPSLAVIVYAIVAGPLTHNRVELDALFMAGMLPGALLVLAIAGLGLVTGKRRGVPRHRFAIRSLARAALGCAWELPIPLLVAGGIYSGQITAIESSAVVAFYVLLVEVFVYRDLTIRSLPKILTMTAELVGAIFVILGMAMALSNYFIDAGIPQRVLALVEGRIVSRLTFLLVLNLFLLVVGCLLDIFSATLLVVPLITPFAQRYGVDPLHLGVIFLTNLEIGYLTPPVGMNLFLSSLRFEKSVLEVARSTLPFVAVLLFCLGLITYVPTLSLWLPAKWMGRSDVADSFDRPERDADARAEACPREVRRRDATPGDREPGKQLCFRELVRKRDGDLSFAKTPSTELIGKWRTRGSRRSPGLRPPERVLGAEVEA